MFLSWMVPDFLLGFTPSQPDPLSELHRWKEQPVLDQELLYVGDVDADGILWLASDSRLIAYDGHTIKQHDFPASFPEMGPGKDILCAENGDLYLLHQKGLIRFQPSRGFDLLLIAEQPVEKGTSLAETPDGSVWLGIRDGLFHIQPRAAQPIDCGFEPIRALEVDAHGDLWIAKDNNEIGIFRAQTSIENPLKQINRISIPAGLDGDNSHIYRKPDGTMWMLITHPAWVVVEFGEDITIQSIPIPDGFETAIGFAYCPMPDGRIVFTEKSTTAQFYNGEWIRLNLDDYPVATHESFAISLPGNQLLIGGSHTQRYLIDLSQNRWVTYLNLVYCDEDRRGREWFIHKNRDVVIHDPATARWSVFTRDDGLIDAPNSIHCGSDGTIWLSGMHENNAAISYYRNGQWHRHSFPGIGYTFGHLAVCELPDGRLIFGNGSDGYYDDRPGGAVLCRPTPNGVKMELLGEPSYPQRPYAITAWGDEGLWIGGRNLFFKTGADSTDLILKDRFQRSWIDHMLVDNQGNLWVANWRLGLFRYDGEDWEEIRGKDNRSSVQATFILQRKNETGILIGNTKGLHRYDGQTWSHTILGDGFRFPKEGASMVEAENGDLWLNFSCRDWLLNSPVPQDTRAHVHRTVRYRSDQNPPETEFTRLEDELNEPANALFAWRGRDRWEDTSRNDLEFSYRLSGREWTPYSKKTEVALLDLPAGTYTLEVRGRDQDFNIDRSPAVASFTVIPPLWKQAWFIMALAGIIASTLLLIFIIIRQRIRYTLALGEFKIDFFTNLSHELRTPLTVILGPLQRLIRHAESPKDKQSLEMIQRNANKMLGLVNQLLEFRKVELGKLEFHPITGEVIGFVKDALYSLSPLWEQKQQSVHIEVRGEPFRCAFDPDKLIRIIDNLLSNAIKYTPAGGKIRISAGVENDASGQSVLKLNIADSGIGIPRSRLNRITEPFYTARNVEPNESSSGIGLALVQELVNLWNGSMSIESETEGDGRGTRVEVFLPLSPPSSEQFPPASGDDGDEEELDPDDAETGADETPTKKVLIIEDNTDLRAFLESELNTHYSISTADNGLAGIELSIKQPPDLIVSDVMMPEMDGIELCKKIRETPEISHIPIILLTAQTGENHYLEGIESGADEYFNKPISVPKLIGRIENLLQSRQNLHDLFATQILLEPRKIAVIPADQSFLENAIHVAEANMQTESFDVEAFAQQMAVSRATLNRKIKAITGTSPKAFIRSMRIKRAAHLLASSDLPINEIFFQVGFYDASNFSRVFKKEFGLTPSQYREEHQGMEGASAPANPSDGAAKATTQEHK